MIKKRIIPIQLLKGGRLFKTVQFAGLRDVGHPVYSSKVYSDQLADELVFLNIDRDNRDPALLLAVIGEVADVCFMPLTFGGGISTLEHASLLIEKGADKVLINSEAYTNKALLERISSKYGVQALVLGVDVRKGGGDYALFKSCGRVSERVGLEDHIRACVASGVGEILINSIDRDGVMKGYDLELINRVCAVSTVPVVAAGGAGSYEDLKEAFLHSQVQGLACGSLFNFGDNNPMRAKAHLSNYGIPFKKV